MSKYDLHTPVLFGSNPTTTIPPEPEPQGVRIAQWVVRSDCDPRDHRFDPLLVGSVSIYKMCPATLRSPSRGCGLNPNKQTNQSPIPQTCRLWYKKSILYESNN